MIVQAKHQRKLQSVVIELTAVEADQIYQYLIGRTQQPEHVYMLRQELYEALRENA